MKRMIVLALVLTVFMFAAAITTPISIPKMDTLNRTLSIENFDPCGDPIDGNGPPGLRNGTGN